MAVEDARAQSDSDDVVAADDPEEEEEKEETGGGASEVQEGGDTGGLLERQRSERVGVLTDLVVATAGEVLRVRFAPSTGRDCRSGVTLVSANDRCTYKVLTPVELGCA